LVDQISSLSIIPFDVEPIAARSQGSIFGVLPHTHLPKPGNKMFYLGGNIVFVIM
jgi:hypothetical protein